MCSDLTLNELSLARRTGSLAGFSLASRFQLAKRQPVLVLGGAAIGSLVLVLFFAGAAKILNQHSKLPPWALDRRW